MIEKYTITSRISAEMADEYGVLAPDAMMSLLQRAAEEHAVVLGIGGERMRNEFGGFWAVVKSMYSLSVLPKQGETISLRTWLAKARRGVVYREYEILLADDVIGDAHQVGALVSMEDRCMINLPIVNDSVNPDVPSPRPWKLHLPDDLAPAGEYTVTETDVDANGHMNNAVYARAACRVMGAFPVLQLGINYTAECRLGEKLFFEMSRDGDTGYVRGRDKDGKIRFETMAKTVLTPIDTASLGNIK